MGRVVRGRLEATDHFDLQFHRILNWTTLEDVPQAGATTGQVMAWDATLTQWAPATISASGVVSVTWGDIQDKPTFVHSVTAGDGIALSATTGSNVEISDSYHTHTNEPTGFINTTDSEISITNNRTFSIEPVASQFQYYDEGVLYTKSATESIRFSATEGLKYFYYDGSTLTVTNTFTSDLIEKHPLIAITYWDSTNNVTLGLGEERHGIVMDGKTHRWIHLERGTIFVSGHALGNIVTIGNGSASTHASLSVAAGTVADEDLYLPADGKSNPANIPVMYLSGPNAAWRKDAARDWPVKQYPAGRLALNFHDGTSWTQVEVGVNDYVLAHIIRTNNISSGDQYIAVQGQSTYQNLGDAQDGAATELNDLVTTGLPVAEFVPLGSVIFQTGNYANTPKARIRPTEAGDSYVDWRFQSLSPASPSSDHGNLSGLADPDHPLTALQQSSASTGQVAEWNGTTWVPANIVNSLSAGTGISLSATTGDVTITNTGGGSGVTMLTALKTATETKNSDATLALDSDLQVELEANGRYSVEVLVRYDAATAADLKFDFQVPSGGMVYGFDLDGGITAELANTVATSLAALGVGSIQLCKVNGLIINASTAGTFGMRWAQQTSNAGNTSLRIGSWMQVVKVS